MEETYSKLNSTQKIVVKLFQQLVTECTGSTTLYTCFDKWLQSVPTSTCYTALYTCFNNWLQSVPAGTGYTALYTCFNNCLQSVPTSTCYIVLYSCFNTGYRVYRLYSLVHLSNWLHMASTYQLQVYQQGTAYTVLTVQCFTRLVT